MSHLVVAMQPDGTLAAEKAAGSAYGLEIDSDATDEQVEALARAVAPTEDAIAWRMADIAVFVEERHGEDWIERVPDIGRRPKTWRNALTDGRAWPDREVRQDWHERGLSRGHLSAVNSKPDEERTGLLEAAIEEGLSVAALRRKVRGDEMSRSVYFKTELREWLDDIKMDLLSDAQIDEGTSRLLQRLAEWDDRKAERDAESPPDDAYEMSKAEEDES